MRTLFAIAALVLLASCAESPTKPTTPAGTGSGSGKVVTATPEETYECDSDLILEPHLPEECIPPEPPEPVKPAEPPKPDPIVGVYVMYYTTIPEQAQILRFYPNNRVHSRNQRDTYRWEKDGKDYAVYYAWDGAHRDRPNFILKYQNINGEPDVVSYGTDNPWRLLEGIKISDNPDHLFDHYKLSHSRNEISCSNIGRKEKDSWGELRKWGKDFADTLEECEALCITTGKARYPQATCPQDRR